VRSSTRSARSPAPYDPSADALGQLDDDSGRAADVDELEHVPGGLHLTDELAAVGPHALDGDVDVLDDEGDVAFYVGSQNVYPARLQELGFIVENPAASARLKSDYLDPLWSHSREHAFIDPDKRKCGHF
jgi:hypothetical protein